MVASRREKIIKAILGFVVSFILINICCFAYSHTPYWYDRTNSATMAIWRPNSVIIQSKEGFGISHVDSNGYINPDEALSGSGYVLVMGSSHTQGKEVGDGYRFTDLLNRRFEDDKIHFYNIGADGHTFNYLVQGMRAALEEFPDCNTVVMEISSISTNLLGDIDYGQELDEEQTGKYLSNHVTDMTRLKTLIKENVPAVYQWKWQYDMTGIDWGNAFGIKDLPVEAYKTDTGSPDRTPEIERIADYLRTQFDGKIIIVYHPACKITDNGIVWEREKETGSFERIMEARGIEVIDTTDVFEKTFINTFELPYGFMNTAPGEGHLNKKGHQIVADLLWKRLMENN